MGGLILNCKHCIIKVLMKLVNIIKTKNLSEAKINRSGCDQLHELWFRRIAMMLNISVNKEY